MPPSYRSVAESPRFEQERNAINNDVKRMDEILDALLWALGKDAEAVGHETAQPGVFFIGTEAWPDCPPLSVYFRYNETAVELLSIRVSPSAESDTV